MTAIPAPRDSASYSTRTCRCGQAMLRSDAAARTAWVCPSCGRRQRR